MKKETFLVRVAAFTAISCQVLTAVADSFDESFDSTSLNTNLSVSASPGFSLVLSDGHAILAQQSGVGNGHIRLVTEFQALGDFIATVESSRTSLAPNTALGLAVSSAIGFADVFFVGADKIYANLYISPGFGYRSYSTTAVSASFRITRSGNTLSLQYDIGSGFQTLHSASHTAMLTPLKFHVFLSNELGNTSFHEGWFDDLSITADMLNWPRDFAASIMMGSGAAVVSWPSLTNRHYQVDYRSDLTAGAWDALLAEPMPGRSGTTSVTNPVVGESQRYYRIVELP